MNFNQYERDLKAFLQDSAGQPYKGVYVISRDKNDTSFKLGMAWGKKGLFGRLKNYKLCFPYDGEYYLHWLVLCGTIADTKVLEKSILNHQHIRNKSVAWEHAPQARLSKEVKVLGSRDVLMNAFIDVLDKNRNHWIATVCFSDNNWKLCTFERRIERGCFMKPSNTRNLRPTIESAFTDYKKKERL